MAIETKTEQAAAINESPAIIPKDEIAPIGKLPLLKIRRAWALYPAFREGSIQAYHLASDSSFRDLIRAVRKVMVKMTETSPNSSDSSPT